MLSSNTPTSELKVSKQNKLFTELSLVIACNKTSEIDKALQTTPDIFLQRDNLGNTLLHYAVMQGNLDSIKKITEFLVESKKINQITDTQNCTNDTLLHLATEFGNYSIVQYLKLTLSSQTVEMSGILNKRGKLPLHLVEENTTTSEHQCLERILQRILQDYRSINEKKITAESKQNKTREANLNKNTVLLKAIVTQEELDLLEKTIDAVSEKNSKEINIVLASTPTITLVRDELNLSLLDYTVMNGNLEIVKLVLEHIEKNKQLDRLINIKNYTEDTLLHIASKFNTSDIIELLIKKLGVKAKTMIETSNKSGETPLSQLSNLPLTERVKANAAVLIPYSIEPKSNLLSKTIDENNCLKLYPEASKNLKLATNIKSCCTAFNKSSKHVRSSDTNAEYNYISYEEKNITAKKITTLREHYTPYFLQFYHHQQPSMKMLEPVIAYIEEFECGNCLESCLWIFKFLSQCTELQKSSIELIHFTNADHVFVVLDRSLNSNISNPITWGDSSVVCDGLTGKVFPAKYFDTQKMYYYNYQHGKNNYNIMALRHPTYHQLEFLISLSNDNKISTNKNALFTKNNCNTTEMTSQQTITIDSSKQGLKL